MNQSWFNDSPTTVSPSTTLPYQQQLQEQEQQAYNDTLVIMNSTQLDDGSLDTLIDEVKNNE